MITQEWTDHEAFLLETIACRVKLLRLDHLQAIWRVVPCGRAPFSLEQALARNEWAIERYRVNLHPPLHPQGPVLTLASGQSIPANLRAYSQILRARWTKPAVATLVVAASKRAAGCFGSTSYGLSPLLHRDHDALLTDAFVFHLQRDPDSIEGWKGEQMLDKNGQYRVKDPDAFLYRSDGTPYKIVESGGSYSANHLREVCLYALQRGYELEVW